MHRSLTLPCLVACLAVAFAAVIGTQPWAAGRTSTTAFQINVESDQPGLVQLYYDLGQGYNERDSVVQPIKAGVPATLRFPLPYGRVTHLRFDPLDRDGRITVSGARIVSGSGRVLAVLGPERFHAWFDVSSAEVSGDRLVITTKRGATDPSFNIALDGPVQIDALSVWLKVVVVFGVLLACVLAASRALHATRFALARRGENLWLAAVRSPVATIALVGLAGTAVANYPIVFAGKSFVAPNLGVALLYGQNPWLPGQSAAEVGDPNKSDVAALAWHHLPLSMIERRAVFHDGELPLWNRYDSAGLPLLGQGQSCFGDPLQIIPVLADGAAWAWDLKFLLAKWVFAFGLGLCIWRCFRHLATCLMLTASSAFIGFFIYRINHPAIFSLCYAPWILFCWLRFTESSSARGGILWLAALIGANFTEMNSGTAKEAYVLLFTMNFTGVCSLLLSERTLRQKCGSVAGALGAGVLFALIASPVWYTFFRALKASYTSYNAPLAFQIQPGMLIGLFDEAFYRPFQLESGVVNPSANFFILVGLLWVVVRARTLWSDCRARALVVASLPAFALVYGVLPPGFIAAIPFLGNILHIDNTFSCALIVILTVLSGYGLRDAWQRLGSPDGKREAFGVFAVAVALFLAYIGTAQSVLRSAYANITWGRVITVDPFIYGYGLSLLVGIAVLLWAGRSIRERGRLSAATLLCVALASGLFHWRETLTLGHAFSPYRVRPTARPDLKAPSPAVDFLLARGTAPFRALGFHNDLLPGWSIAYGIEGISGPDALVNPYYRDLMDTAGVTRIWDWRYIIEPPEVAKLKPIMDALGVRYYLGYHLGDKRPGPELSEILSTDMDVYESRTTWPRAFFTDSAAVYENAAQFWSWLKAGDGRPFAAIDRRDWVNLNPQPDVSGELTARQVSPAEDYRLTTNTTSFTVTATAPGFIVLTEAYEAGNFRAWLNGSRVPYLRVNHAFKGIYVARAGRYEVRFDYWPHGLSTALNCCYLGLAVLFGAVLLAIFVLKPAPSGALNAV